MANTALAQKVKLVKIVGKDGKETSLYQKLITVKQPTVVREEPNPKSKAIFVSPYNVFYHAKTDEGQIEANGFYRVANRSGQHKGWVSAKDVQIWATRFVIKPQKFDAKNSFTIEGVGGTGDIAIYDPGKIPDDATQYAFILGKSRGQGEDAEEIGPFPVAALTARTKKEGVAASLNDIKDLKLEVVFVLEVTDFMMYDYGEKTLFEYMKDLGSQYVEIIKKNRGSDGALPTRLGLVVYQDTNTAAPLKRPMIKQPLTDDVDGWLNILRGLQPVAIKGDFPEDGLSGLAMAVMDKKVNWSQNSSKHIVYIGNAAWQTAPRKQGKLLPGVNHFLDYIPNPQHPEWLANDAEWDKRFGYNSAGLSLSDIHNIAYPRGGTQGDRMRLTVHIHALRAGKSIEEEMAVYAKNNNVDKTGPEMVGVLKQLNVDLMKLGNKNEVIALVNQQGKAAQNMAMLGLQVHYREIHERLALQQYRSATLNSNGNGYFSEIKPDAGSVARVTNELKDRVNEAIQVIADVARGNTDIKVGNEFSEPIYRMVGSSLSKEELIKTPVQVGVASVVSEETGRTVGLKLIMVSREELTRLGGIFNQLHGQFKLKTARADRQNVTGILEELKQSLAQAVSGQEVKADTQLASLITDLPLRTEALKMTAGDIAVMPTKDFTAWLDELQTAFKRTESLLTADAKLWIKISALDEKKDEFGFLRLAELP